MMDRELFNNPRNTASVGGKIVIKRAVRPFASIDVLKFDFFKERTGKVGNTIALLPSQKAMRVVARAIRSLTYANKITRTDAADFLLQVGYDPIYQVGSVPVFLPSDKSLEPKIFTKQFDPLPGLSIIGYVAKLGAAMKLFDLTQGQQKKLCNNYENEFRKSGFQTTWSRGRHVHGLPVIISLRGQLIVPEPDFRVLSPSTLKAIWTFKGFCPQGHTPWQNRGRAHLITTNEVEAHAVFHLTRSRGDVLLNTWPRFVHDFYPCHPARFVRPSAGIKDAPACEACSS